MELAERLLMGDRRAAARLITMMENKDPEAQEIMRQLYSQSGKAYVIGRRPSRSGCTIDA